MEKAKILNCISKWTWKEENVFENEKTKSEHVIQLKVIGHKNVIGHIFKYKKKILKNWLKKFYIEFLLEFTELYSPIANSGLIHIMLRNIFLK